MRFNIERIIDDFVFFCFFIGNDFMPSLSALDIAEGSLDKLIDFYKATLPTLEDYVTDTVGSYTALQEFIHDRHAMEWIDD